MTRDPHSVLNPGNGPPSVSSPSLIAGRFSVTRDVTHGGMGRIAQAIDLNDGCVVAVKLLKAGPGSWGERFQRESEILSAMSHPRVVRYIAHGEATDGQLFLAMEWLEGEDLQQRLLRRGRISVLQSVRIARYVAETLHFAHSKGIFHRDIKPSNIFLSAGKIDRLKLLDFGVALRLASARLTDAGVQLGTPGYMAPEQARADAVIDHRCDLFSLGCVLYECLCGTRAFEGQNVVALMMKILLDQPTPIAALCALPAPLSGLVARLLEKDPAQRPASAAETASILAACEEELEREQSVWKLEIPALTTHEQTVVSLVVMRMEPDESHRQAARAIGGSVECLSDGVSVFVLAQKGTALERAIHAAQLAIRVRDSQQGAMVVATGKGTTGSVRPLAELIEHAVSHLALATDDEILLDAASASLLGDRFVVEERDGQRMLIGERTLGTVARAVLGRPSPFVGRRAELAILQSLQESSIEEDESRAVLLIGDPGVGKSRLCREFLRRRCKDGLPGGVISCRGEVGLASSSNVLFAQIVRAWASLDGGSGDAGRQQLSDRLQALMGASAIQQLPTFAGLCGCAARQTIAGSIQAADPLLRRDQVREAARSWFAAMLAHGPLTIIVDDLHWADQASIELLDLALGLGGPLYVIGLARPEVSQRLPLLWTDRHVTRIGLTALSAKASRQLVAALLPDAPDTLTRHLVAQANGNAFFLEELVAAVAEGTVDTLPDTVLGVMQLRFAELAPELRRVLRAASVFGSSFSSAGVALLLGRRDAQAIRDVLGVLIDQGFVLPASGPDGATPGYSFSHHLLRDCAYAMLTEDDRRLGHRLAGAWLERQGTSDPLVLAQHHLCGDNAQTAARWFVEAASLAMAENDPAEAKRRAEQGIACGADGRTRAELVLALAEAERRLGDYQAAQKAAGEAAAEFELGSKQWLRAMVVLVDSCALFGQFDLLQRWSGALLQYEPKGSEATTSWVRLMAQLGLNLMFGGQLELALSIEQAIKRAEAHTEIADPLALGRREMFAAQIALFDDDLYRAAQHEEAALRCFQQVRYHRMESVQWANIGYLYMIMGDFETARQHLTAGVQVAERHGLAHTVAFSNHVLAMALALSGEWETAIALETQAIIALRRHGDLRMEGGAWTTLAYIHWHQGDLDSALACAERAAPLLESFASSRAGLRGMLSLILLSRGEVALALQKSEEGMRFIRSGGRMVDSIEVTLRLAHMRAMHASGQIEEARALASESRRIVLARARRIPDPKLAESLKTRLYDNAEVLRLAKEWGC